MASMTRDVLYISLFVFICRNQMVKATSNVAIGKSAYQSSTHESIEEMGYPYKAVDGNTNGYYRVEWSCIHTESASNNYWEVNLDTVYIIYNVVVYNRLDSCCKDRAKNIQVFVGFDQTDYKLVGYREGLLGNKHTFPMNEHTYGRWVRIAPRGITDFFNICEVEVYGELLTDTKVRFQQFPNMIGNGMVLGTFVDSSKIECALRCTHSLNCVGFTFNSTNTECMVHESADTNEDSQNGLSFYRLG